MPPKLKLSAAEKRILLWIIKEWDSDWINELDMTVEGTIDFCPKITTRRQLANKGVIDFDKTNLFIDSSGLQSFHCTFYPLTVLKYYCGVDFQLLTDPNGKPILSLLS